MNSDKIEHVAIIGVKNKTVKSLNTDRNPCATFILLLPVPHSRPLGAARYLTLVIQGLLSFKSPFSDKNGESHASLSPDEVQGRMGDSIDYRHLQRREWGGVKGCIEGFTGRPTDAEDESQS